MHGSIGTAKTLPEAMQTLFTRLTISQTRKRQFYRREGFRLAIVTIGGHEIALGKNRDGDFAVFQYNKSTKEIGRLMSAITVKSDHAHEWYLSDTKTYWESPETLIDYHLSMAALYDALRRET